MNEVLVELRFQRQMAWPPVFKQKCTVRIRLGRVAPNTVWLEACSLLF